MLNKDKQEILEKLNSELDEIISRYGESIKRINNLANEKGVAFKDLDIELDDTDGDLSLVLGKLLRIYGEIQSLRETTETSSSSTQT